MGEAYSVYWSRARWQRAVDVSDRLTVFFGGPHQSEPSFQRATVRSGDLLYPIGLRDQVLYVLGRMRVQEIVPVESDQRVLDDCFARLRSWRFLAPTCTTEVVFGNEGTGINLDRPVPGEILKRLTYRPRSGPRPVKHVSEDGRLLHALSVRGIYRLSESSAADFDAILAGPPGESITWPSTRRRQETPEEMDSLF